MRKCLMLMLLLIFLVVSHDVLGQRHQGSTDVPTREQFYRDLQRSSEPTDVPTREQFYRDLQRSSAAVAGRPNEPSSVQSTQARVLSARSLMSPTDFRAAGLHKLSESELKALDRWLNNYTGAVLRISAGGFSGTSGRLEVEATANDETFVINGEVFKAQTYCFNIDQGDRVLFIEGNANGVCATAKFLVMRTGNVCEVWCE